jgi:MFS family permease
MATPLSRTFWVLWTGTLVNRLGGFVGPFLALYLMQGRGVRIEVAGLVASLYAVGGMVASLVGGVLADRLGRRAVLLISLLGGPPLMLALGLAHSLAAIACLAPIVSGVYELYRPAVSAMVADVVPASERPRAYGLLYWAINFGAAVAPVLAGLMARRSYLWLFVADAVTTFLYGLIVATQLGETKPPVALAAADAPGLVPVLADRLFLSFCGLTFVSAMLFTQGWTSLSLHLARAGFATSTYGPIIAVNGLLIILVQPFAGRLLGRLDRGRILVGAALLLGAGLLANGFVDRAWLYGAAVAVWTLGEIASLPLASAIVADLAPADRRGRYQGMYSAAWGVGSTAAPTAGALLLGIGHNVLWWACGAFAVVLALGYRWFGGALRASGRGGRPEAATG